MTLEAIRDETTANQARAADPAASVWVSANAGTGKTSVLVRRVLRLLLVGTAPERILCLTYTKTAAAEMENRLFGELERWAVQPIGDLEKALKDLEGGPADEAVIARARRLFATTLETSGGLKIHTIHAFCQRLLARFPLEAGVPAGAVVLEEAARARLLSEAVDEVLRRAAADGGGALGAALGRIVAAAGEDQFRRVVEALLSKPEALRDLAARKADRADAVDEERAALCRLLGVRDGATDEGLLAEQAGVLDRATLERAADVLEGGKKTDQVNAAALRQALAAPSDEEAVPALARVFLRADGEPRAESRFVTKAVREQEPDVVQTLLDAQARFFALARERAALGVARASSAALHLASEILAAYEARKAARAALDYDDLIARTVQLLARSDAAAWVLYKLDGGIDHILVDEAQDTSPLQWRVIDLLAAEFFAGEGAREARRTIFAVGDEKQSIYSFQGADPAKFAEQGRKARRGAQAARQTWHGVPLNLSFRSTAPILEAVDAVFAQPQAASGLTWAGAPVAHHASRSGDAGLVEIWPLEAPEDADPAPAFEPLGDWTMPAAPADRLAERIAQTIRNWLDDKEPLISRGRPVAPGDILILVRKRQPFVAPMIRALKAKGVPVAGADRMQLCEQLAVMDLMSLGDFLLMPEDDLALATVLKSPLFDLDDDDLFELAYKRHGSLWAALRAKADVAPAYGAAVKALEAMLRQVDYLPPYEFFARLLEADRMAMRRRLLRRLGPDAGDAIDEFLDLALDYDRTAPPSMQGFLDALRRADAEVKRDMEQGRDEVRVMTVHGAKGLEAGIVFLPDTCSVPRAAGRPSLFDVPRRGAVPGVPDHVVWAPGGAGALAELETARAARRTAELEESHRLLYVAMTRARDRLYVSGYEGRRQRDQGCWYDLIFEGVKGLVRETADEEGRPVWRLESLQARPLPVAPEARVVDAEPAPLPDWVEQAVVPERPSALAITPSTVASLEEAEPMGALQEQSVLPPTELADRSRFLRGAIVHALLEHLPEIGPGAWEETARRFVELRGAGLDEPMRAEIVAETLSVMRDPAFAHLFGTGSRAEVPIVARLPADDPEALPLDVSGQIDRLAVLEGEVWIVDYKTNRPPPTEPEDVAPAYLAQLAAYRAAVRLIYGERPVRCALLWTAVPRIMEIPAAAIDFYESRMHAAGVAALDGHRRDT